MKKYWQRIVASLLLVLIVPLIALVEVFTSGHDMPVARGGVIDLRDWDFKSGMVSLNGEWAFYPDALLNPGDFTGIEPGGGRPAPSALVQVPGKWNTYLTGDGRPAAKGYGTYRLQLKVPAGGERVYGLRVGNIRTASQVFLNGQLVGNSGLPADTPAGGRQNNIPYTGFAAVEGGDVDIVIQVANYSYSTGGIISPVVFGDQHSILKSREVALLSDGVVLFSFLLLSFFLLLFSRVRASRGITLYLGLFCMAAFVYILTHGEKLVSVVLPDLPYEIVLKLQLASSTLVYYYLLHYMANSVNYPVSAGLMRMAKAGTGLLLLTAVFVPAYWFSYLEPLLILWGGISLSLVLYYMIQATRRNSKDMFLMMVSIESLSLVIIYYLISITRFSLNYYVLLYEIILFALFQAMVLTRRYAASFREVEQLSRRLLSLDGLKDNFMEETSRELRRPLLGIVNLAQTLNEGAAGTLNAKQSEQLAMIVSTGKRLSSLINDMSDFALLNHGGLFLQRQTVDLRTVATSVLEVTRHLAGNPALDFRLELPAQLPLLDADEQRLIQILFNLFSNAVSHTPGGTITLSAKVQEGCVAVTLADTGIGIAPERLRSIFDVSAADGSDEKTASREYGLGLNIVQKLVELGGGAMSAHSEWGQGSVFTFTVPIIKERPAFLDQDYLEVTGWETTAVTAESEAVGGNSKAEDCCFILVVENDPVNRQVLANALRLENHTVVTASSGPEALAFMQDYPELDLVIMNWVMPEMPGLVLCKAIRERFVLSELPILVLTAGNRPQDIQAVFEAGANDYLSKPVELREFRARVQTLLDMRKSIRVSVQTEIAFLQAQIKPHFLYNALNAIISVCPEDPDKATDLLLDLSQYLRSSFDFQSRGQTVPLDKELDLVKSYLALEQARFDERLRVVFDVPDYIRELVPPLSIQPIVENAVNHGLMQKEAGGTVTLSIRLLPDKLAVAVTDNGIGMSGERVAEVLSEERAEGGIGLRNIQRRLLKMYGTGLMIQSREGLGTTISYAIPRTNTSLDG
ncbi:hybrid sensor histidine kinase/response regulator [Paenibacillus tengchongensis]|uniref:hybrid sensor histidine kinase/response regulator n=1 Tax=Paenibacillus tengchongensis TaxID=2608684 RepID=UPI00124DE905|nr:ATP-binding protein [Paenibacillus tengchongensis]